MLLKKHFIFTLLALACFTLTCAPASAADWKVNAHPDAPKSPSKQFVVKLDGKKIGYVFAGCTATNKTCLVINEQNTLMRFTQIKGVFELVTEPIAWEQANCSGAPLTGEPPALTRRILRSSKGLYMLEGNASYRDMAAASGLAVDGQCRPALPLPTYYYTLTPNDPEVTGVPADGYKGRLDVVLE